MDNVNNMVKEQLEETLQEIDRIIAIEISKQDNIGVLAGLSGISLFHFYYSRYLNNSEQVEKGSEVLMTCVEKLNNGFSQLAYCNGISGFGWVLDHLKQHDFIGIDADGLLTQFDANLEIFMMKSTENENYEFLYGALGTAYYFLNRYENTETAAAKEQYKIILLKFLSLLSKTAIQIDDDKIVWNSILNPNTNANGYNLGVAHGISGIIGILSKMHQHNDFRTKTQPLLKQTVNYILSCKNEEEVVFSYFPNSIKQEEKGTGKSRLAWCYGDLGIGTLLLKASEALQDATLKNEVLDILRHAAKRKTEAETWVNDAACCHGAFGNALLFKRIYQHTEETIFKETADFWFETGFNMIHYGKDDARVREWKMNADHWKSTSSLIEGAAGIGLVIIDFLAEDDLHWDACLLTH
ncbi:lanthionine synthetase C-like protein [Kordia sp. SMS9]|uniref:lanthionine synthetase LanC family protein n=1 Tax=Kordia sp. SMS9 TaxID=2282170 RepID=UPI000E0CCEA9|nr:lanthionine synthetase C family protein [Kordia sp. SMS9]AXG71689.1 lanthionine synthetase C-like protein [Kordia sp. SMS9]